MNDVAGWGKLRWGMSFDDIMRLHPEYKFKKWAGAIDKDEFGKTQHACVIKWIGTEWGWSPTFDNVKNGLTLIELGHTVYSLNEKELDQIYIDSYSSLKEMLGVEPIKTNYGHGVVWKYPSTHIVLKNKILGTVVCIICLCILQFMMLK
jgi:hypothetical protein